jgi:hypothetical protein
VADAYQPTKDDYSDLKDYFSDVNDRQRANAAAFDKAMLTYSSGALGLSIAFLKDIVSVGKPEVFWLLFLSWWLFVGCIIATVVSFMAAQRSYPISLENAKRVYYLNEDSKEHKNTPGKVASWASDAAGVFFCLAAVATTIFVCVNVQRNPNMSELHKIVNPTDLTKGLPAPFIAPRPPAAPQQQPAQNAPQTPPPSNSDGKK